MAPIGRTVSIAPARCDRPATGQNASASLLSITSDGPPTPFSFRISDQTPAGLAAAAQLYAPQIAALDARRLGIRQVPDQVTVVMQRFDGPWMGETTVDGLIDEQQRVTVSQISIRLNVALIQSPAEVQLTFGHEYVHALHSSLGLVQLPADIKEGLGYWVDYTNVYSSVSSPPIDSWQTQVAGPWDLIRDLALTGRSARTGRVIEDAGRMQLGALTTGYLESRLGLRRWLEILLTADLLRVDRDALLAREAGASWPELVGAVRQLLVTETDGGRQAFTTLARSH